MNYNVFKGSRTYLHGTSMFDSIVAELDRPVAQFDFTLKKMTDRCVRIVREKPAAGSIVATYRDAVETLYLEEQPTPISERIAYDEEGMSPWFSVDGRCVTVQQDVPDQYSSIERIVAAFKYLLQQTHSSEHKYLFARLVLDALPPALYSVELTKVIPGSFFQGTVTSGGDKLGFILFGKQQ